VDLLDNKSCNKLDDVVQLVVGFWFLRTPAVQSRTCKECCIFCCKASHMQTTSGRVKISNHHSEVVVHISAQVFRKKPWASC